MKRHPAIVVMGCLLLVSGVCFCVATAQQPETTHNETAQIITLQEERVAALQQLVEICVIQYKTGALPFESVASAQENLIGAQLDSTDKPEERVALLAQQLKIAEGVFNYAETRFKSGFSITQADVLRTKSHYLNVKIRLLRERSRLSPVTK